MKTLLRFAALPAFAGHLWAQCPMCRTAAAAQEEAAARALNAGVLILLLPAAGLFCGVYLFAYSRRDAGTGEEDTQETGMAASPPGTDDHA